MENELLDGCFKCHSKDSVEFILVSTNSAGGQVFKIKCSKCGLSSPEESLRPRLVKWWNDREIVQPSKEILKALDGINKTLDKKAKTKTVKANLEIIQEALGMNIKGGNEE